VALAVFCEDEWLSLCQVIAKPELSNDTRFATLADRKINEDELEMCIEQWTVKHDPEDIMNKLQSAGVSAGLVETFEDLLDKDPQMDHREAFPTVEHPVTGLQIHRAPSYKMSKTPPEIRPAPMLGEHNRYVLKEIAGLSEAEIDDLLVEGCITTETS
jgi:benzylsuccinate CoA-transferase BbsF subunit